VSVIALDFYSPDDPNGTPLGGLDEADLLSCEFRVALTELGSGLFTVSRHNTQATSTLIREDNLVKVRIPTVSADPIFAFWLKEGDFTLISSNEQGGEILTFGGPGVLHVLSRARLHHAVYAPLQPNRGDAPDVPFMWRWRNEPYGAMLVRGIEEGQNEPGEPLADVTINFDRFQDSNSQPWPEIVEDFQTPIGTDVLTLAERVATGGDLFLIGRPNLEVRAYQEYGRDLTGAFASDNVRFEKGVNILTELKRDIAAREMLTHVIVQDSDGDYGIHTWSGYSAGDRATYGFLEVGQTNDPDQVDKIAQATLDASRTSGESLALEITPGFDPANGRYMPGPAGTDGHFWIGDTVTVHTGSGEHDFNGSTQRVVAIRVVLHEAADDSTDDTAARSLHVVPELNYLQIRGFSGVSPSAIGQPGFCCGPDVPTPTDPGTPDSPETVVAAWTFPTGNASTTQYDDTSTYPVSGKWNAAGYAYSTNLTTQVANHSKSPRPPATVGVTYRITGRIKNRDLVRNPDGLSLIMGFKTAAGSTIPTPVNVGNTGATEGVWVTVSGTATAPATSSTIAWGVSSTDVGTSFAVAGTLADVDDVIITVAGSGSSGTPGSGGINSDLIGDTPGQYAYADHTHLTVSSADDPTTGDDVTEGFPRGTFWYNETTGKLFLLWDSTADAAQWIEILTENSTHSHDASEISGLTDVAGTFTAIELTAAPAGGWNGLGKPHAAQHDGKTVVGIVTGDDGDAQVFTYNHLTGEVGSPVTLKAALDVDDHAPPTVLIRDSDKKVLTAYCAHNDTNLYTRLSTNSIETDPTLAGGFAAEVDIDASLSGTNYSYPSLIQLTGETNDPIYLFVRRVSGGASQTWGYSTSTDGGSTWSALTTFFSVSGRWGYVTMVPNGDDRIDFFAQDGSAGAGDATVSIYHFYLEGGSWKKSDGTSAGSLPLDETDLTVVHSGASGGSKHIADIAIDPDTGYPVVAYKNFTGATTADYRWGRWTGSAWSTSAVAGDGYFAVNYQSGDLCLDKARPTIVYASRDVDGVMQMFRYHTRDRGTTWSEEQLTTEATDSIFPLSPHNRGAALPVLWMNGTWTGATTYSVGTYGLVGEQAEPEGSTGSSGVTDHGALTGLSDDDHTQYTQKATLTTTGDLYYASSASTPARRGIGSEGQVLSVVSGVPNWADAAAAVGLIPVDTGSVAYDTSTPGELGITVTSDWGYDGAAYYDDTGAATGEEAALFWDPDTGQYTVITFDF
jgi:hypothetical protein